MSSDPASPHWRFRGSAVPENPREERRQFLGAAQTALRVGHGLAAEFRLWAASGPAGSIGCVPKNAVARRWFTRALVPAYDRGQWSSTPSPIDCPPGTARLYGSRLRGWPFPLRMDDDAVPAFDSVTLALFASDPGTRLDWVFRPVRLHRPLIPRDDSAIESPPRSSENRTLRTAVSGVPFRPATPGDPCFWSSELMLRSSGSTERLSAVARTLESALRSDSGNGVRFRRRGWSRALDPPFLVSDRELALILPRGSGLRWGNVPGSEALGGPFSVVGRTESGEVVRIPVDPRQGRHLAVLGETGMGKSSLLVAMGRQAAAFSGVILLDPLGDTAESFGRLLGPGLRGRMTFASPLSSTGINALGGIGPSLADPAARERRLNDLVHALRRVRSGRYADASYWGPRLEEMLQRALSVAAALPDGTLEDAHLLLASGGRGFRQLPPDATEAANGLAERIRARPEDAEGARRLLYEVVRSPTLVRALCRRTHEARLPELLARGRILLLSGEAAKVGESNARFFLSVYLALLWSTLLAHDSGSKFFVLLDEAQWFAHESLAEMLRLGRRRNVHVLLATQSIASLPEAVQEAVWTNVADFVAFRGSPAEAREFVRLVRAIEPDSILGLPRGHAAALLGKGERLHWIRTVRPPARAPSGSPGESAGDAAVVPPSPPDGGGRKEAGPVVNDPESRIEAVRAALRQRLARAGPGPTVRVPLEDLRKEADPGGRAVRSVGDRLSRAGAIVRTEHGPHGSLWCVDVGRAAVLLTAPVVSSGPGDSDGPQPS